MLRSMAAARSMPLEIPPQRIPLIVGSLPQPALLQGGARFGAAGRWSFYTARPIQVFSFNGQTWRISGRSGSILDGTGDPLEVFGGLLEQTVSAGGSSADPDMDLPLETDPPFQGGWIGYFAYDVAPLLERVPRRAPIDQPFPVIRFALHDWAVVLDHATGLACLHVFDLTGEGGLTARLRSLKHELEQRAHRIRPTERSLVLEPVRSDFARADYLIAVEKALEYIRAGDIFQVNLSQRFNASGHLDPLDLSIRLRKVSPAPFSAYLAWDDLAIVSSSPEWFYQTRGDRIVTRPIKGTRPRGATPTEDQRLRSELTSSEKDRAELTMIVDLERNDLGRVCRYGTVEVTEPITVESYAQVHHLVATIEGRLRPDCGPIDVVRALIPGGSITGAPKIRAMEIIDELEPTRRSVYTGAIGYLCRNASAFNIAIRTMLVSGDRVSFQAGGGIVADSVPELEFEETLHKARGMRGVLEGANS